MDGKGVAERVLVFLLRFGGAVLLLAALAVFLPTDWMEVCHRWLGLGKFPRAPLTEYLTRSISGLYAIHGGLLLVVASDVIRFLPIVRYVALTNVTFGIILFEVDLRAGMPSYWTWSEGPPLVALGVVLWCLARSLERPSNEPKRHWEQVYETHDPAELSWYQEHPRLSLAFIERSGLGRTDPLIDVGGGTSTLVDDLLSAGFENLTVLDISARALEAARARVGDGASRVSWIEGDITKVKLAHHAYALWHDRAVFHFLTDPADRRRYVEAVQRAVRPGGHVIVATFASDGPSQCSGLDVVRYEPGGLHAEFGSAFDLVEGAREAHRTPAAREQAFIYCYCRKA